MATVPDVTVQVHIESANLDAEQLARAAALLCAKRALTTTVNLASTREISPIDLHALAVFILDGGDPWAGDPWADVLVDDPDVDD